jgi:uncharacterized protein
MEYGSAAWSPYLVGALIGVLSMATFYFSDKPLGISTSCARLAGLVGKLVSKGHTETLKFYQDKKPKIECGVMLLFGVVLGAFIAAYTGGEIMAYGARLAGGCTSGHGISGALQLSVSSWIALASFFAAAVGTAMLLYRL